MLVTVNTTNLFNQMPLKNRPILVALHNETDCNDGCVISAIENMVNQNGLRILQPK
jgi:hypothetical protein